MKIIRDIEVEQEQAYYYYPNKNDYYYAVEKVVDRNFTSFSF